VFLHAQTRFENRARIWATSARIAEMLTAILVLLAALIALSLILLGRLSRRNRGSAMRTIWDAPMSAVRSRAARCVRNSREPAAFLGTEDSERRIYGLAVTQHLESVRGVVDQRLASLQEENASNWNRCGRPWRRSAVDPSRPRPGESFRLVSERLEQVA